MRVALAWLCVVVGCGSQDHTAPPAPAAPTATPSPTQAPKPAPQVHKRIEIPVFAFRVGDALDTFEKSEIVSKPGSVAAAMITTLRKRHVEVLEVSGDLITKCRVTYSKDDGEVIIAGQKGPDLSLLDASFLVRWTGNKLAIVREDGASIDKERMRRLTDDLRGTVGVPDFAIRAVAASPQDVGTARPLPKAEMPASIGDIVTVRQAVVRLLAARGDTAELEEVTMYVGSEPTGDYSATARTVSEVSIANGRRTKSRAMVAITFMGYVFDATSTVTYRYVTPGR